MSNTREKARQFMLAYRRENGRKALADLLADNHLPTSFADIRPEHADAIIGALSAKLSPAAIAEAERLANGGASGRDDADEDDKAPAAACSRPKSFAEIDPAKIYDRWNSAKQAAR